MENILSLRFTDKNQFKKAKAWFENKSIYNPDIIDEHWMSFDFECTCGGDVDSLEVALETELVVYARLDNFYFESN